MDDILTPNKITIPVNLVITADTEEEAKAIIERLMRVGLTECMHHEPLTWDAFHHWEYIAPVQP